LEQIVGVLKRAEVDVSANGNHQTDLLPVEEEAVRGVTNRSRPATEAASGEENARLKRLVAELSLDKTMLQDVLAKKL
jgi:putative transposase